MKSAALKLPLLICALCFANAKQRDKAKKPREVPADGPLASVKLSGKSTVSFNFRKGAILMDLEAEEGEADNLKEVLEENDEPTVWFKSSLGRTLLLD
jgi:hypothetical protein